MFRLIFFPVIFNLHSWLFNSLLIPGDQTNKLRDVMAANLLYRCKHLSTLKFRVVSPSLTNKYIYCKWQADNKSDTMISVM